MPGNIHYFLFKFRLSDYATAVYNYIAFELRWVVKHISPSYFRSRGRHKSADIRCEKISEFGREIYIAFLCDNI